MYGGTMLQNIYDAMMNREHVSKMSAFELYHCQGLSPRLAELRQLGVQFTVCATENGITRYFMTAAQRDYNNDKFWISDIVAKKHSCTKKAKR